MRTQARTAAFMPGESPPDVMMAIFFLVAIVTDVLGVDVVPCSGGAGRKRPRQRWNKRLRVVDRARNAKKVWKGTRMRASGWRTKNPMLRMGMLQGTRHLENEYT